MSYEELLVVLVHYTKGRGFKSNRKVKENEDKEKATQGNATDEQKLLGQISKTEESLKRNDDNYTITNLLVDNFNVKGRMRNTSGKYLYGTTRAMIKKEVEIILDNQVKQGLITEDFKKRYLDDILLFQRTFSQGPDKPSQYHDWLNKAVGTCTFEKGRPRAAKASLSYELFVLVQKLQNIRFKVDGKWDGRLSPEQVRALLDKALDGKNITYKIVSDEIGKVVEFKGLSITKSKYRDLILKLKEKDPELETLTNEVNKEKLKEKVHTLEQYKKLRNKLDKIFGKEFVLERKQYDLLADCLTRCKSDEDIENYIRGKRDVLVDVEVSDELIEFTKAMNDDGFKAFGKLSYECLYNITPLMIDDGKEYSEAIAEKYGHHSVKAKIDNETDSLDDVYDILEKLDKTINNRSVIRTLVESRKVINAVIKRYGKPVAIHIELARELTKSDKERDQVTQSQLNNRASREAIRYQIFSKHSDKFHGVNSITSEDITQYRLFIEQDGICPYTLLLTGNPNEAKIFENELFTSEVEIDHIIPYSKCQDDRLVNKSLVKKKTNQEKSNQTPLEAFGKEDGRDMYESWIKGNTKIGQEKETRYLTEKLTNSLLNDFRPRTLNDTRYATKALKEILEYSFPSVKVRSFTGQITAKYRNVYRLNNLTHSYISPDYVLRKEENEELERLYKELGEMIENNVPRKDKDFRDKQREIGTIVKNQEKARENHLHHAIDATLIAVATNKVRGKIQRHEIALRLKNDKDALIKVPIVDEETGEFLGYEENPLSVEHYRQQAGMRAFLDRSLFPQPYEGFTDELIYRVYERDEERLQEQLSSLDNYNDVNIEDIKPLFISHHFSAKVSGKLHKETNYGARERDGKAWLTQRIEVNNDKLKKTTLNNIVDKDTAQKYVYQALVEWLDNYKDGKEAYEARGFYPKNKNGNEIKRIKVYDGEVKEAIKVKQDEDKYVMKDDVVQVHIYERENDDKLYFVGMDRFRVMNAEKRDDLSIMLWTGQTNSISMTFDKLKDNGFVKPPMILNKGQIINIENNKGSKGQVMVVGFSGGRLEIDSILGDAEDLIHKQFFIKQESQFRITVSNIKSIKPISVDILGKIHSKI